MNLHFKRTFSTLLGLSALGIVATASGDAHALSCDEIMNMVNVNVPANIIVQTMEDSGDQFTNEEIKCLSAAGAPDEVVTTAKKMSAASRVEEPTVERGGEGSDGPSKTTDRNALEDANRIDEGRGGRGGRGTYDDLPEDGGDQADRAGGACADDVDQAVEAYKAKKFLGSSLALFKMLEDATCPEQKERIQFYLGMNLYELEMYHSSQYYFMQVVKKGSNGRYFKYALPKVVAIARYTGDDSELMRLASAAKSKDVPIQEYPRKAQNYMAYLYGVDAYEDDELSDARRYFGMISTKSDLYLKSKYFEGVIYRQQDRYKSSVKSFRDVIRDSEQVTLYTDGEVAEVERLTDLSLVNIARIYYSIQRFDESEKYYSYVPRDSDVWAESLFESAWAKFMQGELNSSLGHVLTVQSPFYDTEEFIPEATILRALTFFNLCEYKQVEFELIRFENSVRPMYQELIDFIKQYQSKDGRKLADQAFEAYFEGVKKDTVLPKSMFTKFLRNQDLYSLVRHLQVMDEEERKISAQKSLWRDSLGAHLNSILEKDRRRYKQRAGLVMLKEMAQMSNQLGDLLTQSEIIRFEVVSAQRIGYEYAMSSIDLADTKDETAIDFATSRGLAYWPFNGEFWQDELGYYYYTEQSSCE